jgi:hypothetical protein
MRYFGNCPVFGGTHTPTRESDGPAYLSRMVDARQQEQHAALTGFHEHIAAARTLRDDPRAWCYAMNLAGFYRSRLMSRRQQGWKLDAVMGTPTRKAWKDAK